MDKILKFFRLFLALFPSRLPVGSLAFDEFAKSIIDLYGLPDLPSYRHAVATSIMHLGSTSAFKSKFYFAMIIRKAMANQVAYEKIQEFREMEKLAQEKMASVTPINGGSTPSEPKTV